MNQPELEAITCTMLARSATACACKSRFIWFYFSLAEKVARVLSNNQSPCGVAKPKQTQFTFDPNLKTTLVRLQLYSGGSRPSDKGEGVGCGHPDLEISGERPVSKKFFFDLFELSSFHSAWHQHRNAASLKKNSLLLIFSSIAISSIRRYVYAHVFMPTKLYKGAWNVSANNSETVGHKDLNLGQIAYILLFYKFHFLGFFHWTVFNLFFMLRDSENDLYRIYLV